MSVRSEPPQLDDGCVTPRCRTATPSSRSSNWCFRARPGIREANSPSPRTRVPLPWRRGATAGGRLGATWQRAAMSAHGDSTSSSSCRVRWDVQWSTRRASTGCVVHALEAGGDVGGTWYWNRYPARAATSRALSILRLSDDFAQTGSDGALRQPAEILAYADHVATRFDLRRDISFTTRCARRPSTRRGRAG